MVYASANRSSRLGSLTTMHSLLNTMVRAICILERRPVRQALMVRIARSCKRGPCRAHLVLQRVAILAGAGH